MAACLGVSGYYHDAAAALVVDGEIVAAIQEERLSGQKNDAGFPHRAIKRCLEIGDIDGAALDLAVFYENPFAKLERVMINALRVFPRAFRQFPRAMAGQLSSKIWVLDRIADVTGLDRSKVDLMPHHESHAASAFYTSPYRDAAVVTIDGVGEETTTAIWSGSEEGLSEVSSIAFPHSLGLLYAALTAYLGFSVNEGEYKVMGLAAYGSPRFGPEFEKLLRLNDDGSFELEPRFFRSFADPERAFGAPLQKLLGAARRAAKPWNLEDPEDQRYADIAASLQRRVEDAVIGLARAARATTGATNLCLAGGVALNCVANRRIAAECGFERVYVHPAAGDAGGALGAAITAAITCGDSPKRPLTTAALGVAADPTRTRLVAEQLGLSCERLSDPVRTIVDDLQKRRIVGLCCGKTEWGPRALGFRSILADPANVEIRERLNRSIKLREPFRPFAPAVLQDEASTYYQGAPNDMTRFMTTVCDVKEPQKLAATTHVDGTARVQTTCEQSSPTLHAILQERKQRGALPIVLNTSLNGPAEPIAADGVSALATFLSRPLDALFVEDVMITKP